MKMELIAYAAGIFDGEGSIYLSKRHNGSLAVKVTNTDKRLCQLFYEHWKGSLQEIKPNVPNHKTLYRWYIYGQKAKPLLLALKPYSIHKAELISLALKLLNLGAYVPSQSPEGKQRQLVSNQIYAANQ